MPGFISSPPRATETPPKVTEAVQKELPYAIVNYPGKGRGLQASTPITKGSRILSEAPLLVIDEEPSLNYNKAEAAIARQLEDMSLEAQSEVLQLHNAHIDDLPELAGIFQTNGFTLDDGKVALFRHTCLINHSCQPNVEAEWNGNSGQMVVHAIRDLAPGEEYLSIS